MLNHNPTPAGRRALGYWMGYRIDQAFYAQAKDKTAALRAMLGRDGLQGLSQGERLSGAEGALWA
jgi:hypothetical protein